MFTAYYSNWDYWQLYHKVTFDGTNKLIYINDSETNIDVKQDIYSAWKEWLSIRDYAKFLPAIRVTGGDPTPTGYAGDMYFLMNGWQIVIPHEVELVGILYHDDPISPYIVQAGGGVVATVSNLALGTTGGSGATAIEVRQEMDVNSTKLSSLTTNVANIPSAVRTELTTELTHLMNLANTPAAPSANDVAEAVRTELAAELAIISSQVDGLTPSQLTMLTEIYQLMGLDPTKPLIVTDTVRQTGDGTELKQTIVSTPTQTTVTRV